MAFEAAQARQQDAVFATFGIDADWEGIADPVRVILRDSDQIVGLSVDSESTIRVRPSQVCAPAKGNLVKTETRGDYEIIGTPKLDRNGTWRCEAKPV